MENARSIRASPMRWRLLTCVRGCAAALASLSLCLQSGAATAEDFSPCRTGLLKDLGAAMKAHNEHVYRMNRKFKDIWYFQGPLPPAVASEVKYESLHQYLARLAPRKAALLFHATDENRLCTWLVTQRKGDVVHHLQKLSPAQLENLSPSLWQDLGVRTVRKPRMASPEQARSPLDAAESKLRWNTLLERIGGLLLPPPVAARLLADEVDTLIVVPVSVRAFRYGRDEEGSSATAIRRQESTRELATSTRLALAVSTVPFLALPLGRRQLVDRMSVVIAPGFLPFAGEPLPPRSAIAAPLVVGAAASKGSAPLPGAQAEVERIAAQLKTHAITGGAARKDRVLGELAARADALDFILFATHGRASAVNPIDHSYIELSDSALTAREISRLRRDADTDVEVRLRQRPLVVMSACETGLGKDFAVGTIGLARAWQWAGASSVVMSLWSVDDQATRDLMIDFVDKLRSGRPADQALREAAINARRLDDNPAFWAAFSVFGAPERVRPQ